MGYYINTDSNFGKAKTLVDKYNATLIPVPKSFSSIPADKALVCVVDNGIFEAAGYCFDEREFKAFNDSSDMRPKKWLLMDGALVKKLSDYRD